MPRVARCPDPRLFPLAALLCAALATACARGERKPAASDSANARMKHDSVSAALRAAAPSEVGTLRGYKTPESVRYDSVEDVFYISNINGDPAAKDNNGFISRISANPADSAQTPVVVVEGGKNGVQLNAPKGLALVGDTIWVADIDVVRAFNKKTGAVVATVDLRPKKAVFLNDVVAGPDGSIYITDTAIRFEGGQPKHVGVDRIFRIAPDHSASVLVHDDILGRPNGIAWDPAGKRLIVVSFGARSILAVGPGDSTPRIIGYGSGQMDGVELLADGRMLVTSWADSTLAVRQGNTVTMIRGLPSPADIGVDTRRQRVAVPLFTQDRVELFASPPKS
jgi:sugar lactone lactonase YvrE